jgi:glycosyltransferase involved in cell wall biosynthesis
MDTQRLTEGLSVVIPVYNSAETLDELVTRLSKVLPGLTQNYELIMVNDSSPDGSWQEITRLAGRFTWIKAVNLMRNYGQHNATLCGIRAARYATTVTMDDDLQHPPEEIHKLLARLAQGGDQMQRVDVVYGLPQVMPHSWWRNMFSFLIKRFLALAMGVKNLRDFAAFRAFRTDLRRAFSAYQNPNVIIDVLLSWATTRFATVTVDEKPRAAGRSNYSFMKLFQYTMVVLTGFSTLPLRIASLVGFVFTIFGLLVLVYVLGVYIFAGSVPGFPFLASLVAVFSGVQLFALGIIGEYLARIFDRSMDRPPYIVEEVFTESPDGVDREPLNLEAEQYHDALPK